MTVDAHHHVRDLTVRDRDSIRWDEPWPPRRNFTVEDVQPQARAAGVDRMVLVRMATVPEETPELPALADARDLIAGVVGWVDLARAGIAGEPAARPR